MEILYLLLPLSVALVLLILGVLGWAVHRGQFDELQQEGVRILHDDPPENAGPFTPLDPAQHAPSPVSQQ